MIINSTINENTGGTATNAYTWIAYDTSSLLVTGKVTGVMNTFRSLQDFNEGKAEIVPIDNNGDRIKFVSFQLTPDSIVKSGPNCTITDVALFFNEKAAEYLENKYGWDITL